MARLGLGRRPGDVTEDEMFFFFKKYRYSLIAANHIPNLTKDCLFFLSDTKNLHVARDVFQGSGKFTRGKA